ncbi:MAG: capsular exopolysaccharide family [Ferruginibacter sp.]|uniref:GumC family protein n=1 Tax=Ferruginibacter sp. TaxID=1940288 RepID=UPI00265A29C1|nr:polysaccharide biosynthesis tyrosine autokinase [Ferruginibacter sp.]MDB5280382.1 capsular exopolysaccharide family [Ferruginibacter sp.]
MQQQQPKAAGQKQETSFILTLLSYVPYWPLFIIFLFLSGLGAFLYLRYTRPQYESRATIIIKDEKKGETDSRLVQSLNLVNSSKIIENEVEVLQSRSLMSDVVKNLRLYAPVSQEGKIKAMSGYQLSPVKVEVSNPDSLQPSKKIMLEVDEKNNTVLLNKTFKGAIDEWLKTPYGTLKFVHNDKYVPLGIKAPYYFSLVPVDNMASWLLSKLKVSASSKQSSVINLSFRDESPVLAADVLNQLIIAYGEAALREKNSLAKNTLVSIEDRLNIVAKDLDSIESKLQHYKAGKGAVDIGRQGQLYLENVSANDKRISDLNMQVDIMNQLKKSATTPGNVGVLPSTLGVSDPALINQVNKLSSLQSEYDNLKTTVAENNPVLLSLKEQINQIKPTILTNIESQQRSLEKSRDNLYATKGSDNAVLSAIPQKERELVEITRDQNIKNGIYAFLLQKREESQLSYASNIADSKVINYAVVSNSPVSPNRMMIYAIAFAIALGFPIAIITAKDALSPKILYRSEIETLTEVPVIGEISKSKSKQPIVVQKGVRTVIAEEFRKVRVSLLSLGINADHKKILVTSNISGEGKSFIAANLAHSIALTGKKVILLDLDLHNPGLGRIINIREQPGVSEYLMGKASLDSIIHAVPDNNHLFYIPCGELEQDASELLENGKIGELISRLDENFDMIVIDTAPVVLITDAYLLSSLCDATLFVVRHKFTPKMLVKRMDGNMVINPIKNPGIIFNSVNTRGFFKNNYGYGYNYVYSYDNRKTMKA